MKRRIYIITVSFIILITAKASTTESKTPAIAQRTLQNFDITYKPVTVYKGDGLFTCDESDIECNTCCDGVPPACVEDGINCYTDKNPDSFPKLYRLLAILFGFVLGPTLIISLIDYVCIYKPCRSDFSICQCFIFVFCYICCFRKTGEKEVDETRKVKNGTGIGASTGKKATFGKNVDFNSDEL